MNWRDIVIGAVASLAVTIIGGVAVYYATKEPDTKRTERLVYSIQQTASFTGEAQDLAFASVRVSNQGGVAAKHVTVLVTQKAAEIRDLSIDPSPGLKEVSRNRESDSVQLDYSALLPGEAVTINLLLSLPENPVVSVRSESTRGVAQDSIERSSRSPNSKLNRFSEILVPATGLLSFALFFVSMARLRRFGYLDSFSSDRNSVGFLLLHSGLITDADHVLTAAVRAGRHDAYALSNLATCKALTGDQKQAEQLLRAAKFRERKGHINAVVLFNRAIIHLVAGEKAAALQDLRDAIKVSPKEIRRYCEGSVHLDVLRDDQEFKEITKKPTNG